jgi:hypothetical protein
MKSCLIRTIVVCVGMGCLQCSPSGEEGKVKKQFELLSEWVSKSPGEKPLTTARKIRNIETVFAGECTLSAHDDAYSGIYTPEGVSTRAAAIRSQLSKLAVRFYDFGIDISQEGLAKVRVTAIVSGTSRAGDHLEETHELSCILKKIEETWLFSRVEVVEVLKK